ncbi:polyprenyl synthetase family protein [Streptomyces sp. NPDC049813]|uniref:polyprenyl synthetase family protein n=1 Tax=Streptomyces sp. NPDC049813 TaxID=3365597 RepID=UPI00379B6AA0
MPGRRPLTRIGPRIPGAAARPLRQLVAGKTGSLMGCAFALGGALAGADAERVAVLRDFGSRLGVAFQCADDVFGGQRPQRHTG